MRVLPGEVLVENQIRPPNFVSGARFGNMVYDTERMLKNCLVNLILFSKDRELLYFVMVTSGTARIGRKERLNSRKVQILTIGSRKYNEIWSVI